MEQKLLPIEQRSLGDVYQIMAHKSIQEVNRTLADLPADHPAKGQETQAMERATGAADSP